VDRRQISGSTDETTVLLFPRLYAIGCQSPRGDDARSPAGGDSTSNRKIKEGDMSSTQSSGTTFQVKSGSLILGAALIGAGWVLGLIGLTICSSTVIAATRRWVKQMDVPPSELARLKWEQAKAATAAGTSAWQDGATTSQRS
jgi:hypothetical protein